jgi:hypothetical protein
VDLGKWLTDGNAAGTALQIAEGRKPLPSSTDGLFIPGTTVRETPSEEQSSETPEDAAKEEEDPKVEMGCYLVYDSNGCRLIQHFSKTRIPDAIGFFAPGPETKIPAFKFKSNQGRSEIIGNCASGVAGRKNYYSGWCQFVRAAKSMQGTLWMYPRGKGQSGLDVDVYLYHQKPASGGQQTTKLSYHKEYDVSHVSAVACLPKHSEFFDGLTMDLTRWVEEGSKVGATIQI